MIKILCSTEFSKLYYSLNAPLWKQQIQGRALTHGKSIQIWSHRWLPVKHSPMISSPVAVMLFLWTQPLLMFCWILREDNRTMTCWMDSLFPKWPTSSGASPYLVLKQKTNSIELVPQSTPSSQETQLWKGLWSLHTPSKVKNHIWRACRNSLPTKENLLRRTIITKLHLWSLSRTCRVSLTCNVVVLQAGWSLESELWGFHQNHRLLDFKELLSWILQHHQNPKLFSMVAWSIWTDTAKLSSTQSTLLRRITNCTNDKVQI